MLSMSCNQKSIHPIFSQRPSLGRDTMVCHVARLDIPGLKGSSIHGKLLNNVEVSLFSEEHFAAHLLDMQLSRHGIFHRHFKIAIFLDVPIGWPQHIPWTLPLLLIGLNARLVLNSILGHPPLI
ncbi:hypothetical protein DDE05_38025 [Streptomyces cavourensis]|nr:hypothetical protein DDE05_38025 [Streptomyces cavourensis]